MGSSLVGFAIGAGLVVIYVGYLVYLRNVETKVEKVPRSRQMTEVLKGVHHIDIQLLVMTILLALILWRVW